MKKKYYYGFRVKDVMTGKINIVYVLGYDNKEKAKRILKKYSSLEEVKKHMQVFKNSNLSCFELNKAKISNTIYENY